MRKTDCWSHRLCLTEMREGKNCFLREVMDRKKNWLFERDEREGKKLVFERGERSEKNWLFERDKREDTKVV